MEYSVLSHVGSLVKLSGHVYMIFQISKVVQASLLRSGIFQRYRKLLDISCHCTYFRVVAIAYGVFN